MFETAIQLTAIGASTVAIVTAILSAISWFKKSIIKEMQLDLSKINIQMNLQAQENEQSLSKISSDLDSICVFLERIEEKMTYMNFDLTTLENRVYELEYKPQKLERQQRPSTMRERVKRGRRSTSG